ncbi:MAG: putative Ig domain-containing protein [Planctomycetes bacterium]|nr:putative Ig domain-containing protein [Planctomycetota bacterium]
MGTLAAADLYGTTLVMAEGGSDNASFYISGASLCSNVIFDYETQSTRSVRIGASNGSALIYEETLLIQIGDTNESPTSLSLSGNIVPEHGSHAPFAELSGSDPDSDTLAYTLVSGTGSDDNEDFNILSGNLLDTHELASRLYKTSYRIRLRVTDPDNLYLEQAFMIGIDYAPDFASAPPTSIQAVAGLPFSYQLPAATDFEGQTVSYSAKKFPSWASFDASTRTLSGTPPITSQGQSLPFTVWAYDTAPGSKVWSTTISVMVPQSNDSDPFKGMAAGDKLSALQFRGIIPEGQPMAGTEVVLEPDDPRIASFGASASSSTGSSKPRFQSGDVGADMLNVEFTSATCRFVERHGTEFRGQWEALEGETASVSILPGPGGSLTSGSYFEMEATGTIAIEPASWQALKAFPIAAIGESIGFLSENPDGSVSGISFDMGVAGFAGGSVNASVSKGIMSASRSMDMSVEVQTDDNHTPTLSLPNLADVQYGVAFSARVTATDADGDAVTLAATNLSPWMQFNPTTGVLSGTPPKTALYQRFTVAVTASDTDNASAAGTISFVVKAPASSSTVVSSASLRALIQDANAVPISGARVQVLGTSLQALSGSDGIALLTGFSTVASPYSKIRVFAEGYAAGEVSAPARSMSVTVTLSSRHVAMSGLVVDGSANPVVGALATAWHASYGYFSGTTDVGGRYDIAVPGTDTLTNWSIAIKAAGYQLAQTSASAPATASRSSISIGTQTLLPLNPVISWYMSQNSDGSYSLSMVAEPPLDTASYNTLALGGATAQSQEFTSGDGSIQLKLNPAGSQSLSLGVQGGNSMTRIDLSKSPSLACVAAVDTARGGSGSLAVEQGPLEQDPSGFEVPPFGVSSEVSHIRFQRLSAPVAATPSTKLVGVIYSVDALKLIVNGGSVSEEVLGANDIRSVILRMQYDPDVWDPDRNRVVFSSDNGVSWSEHPSSDIVAIDTLNHTVSVQTTHLSLWGFDTSGVGLAGRSGSGSAGSPGGCILSR